MDGIGIGMLTPVINEWLLSQRRGQLCTYEPLLDITNRDASIAFQTGNLALRNDDELGLGLRRLYHV
jgi:hypothetical protein